MQSVRELVSLFVLFLQTLREIGDLLRLLANGGLFSSQAVSELLVLGAQRVDLRVAGGQALLSSQTLAFRFGEF
jgi:hypothetical protein